MLKDQENKLLNRIGDLLVKTFKKIKETESKNIERNRQLIELEKMKMEMGDDYIEDDDLFELLQGNDDDGVPMNDNRENAMEEEE